MNQFANKVVAGLTGLTLLLTLNSIANASTPLTADLDVRIEGKQLKSKDKEAIIRERFGSAGIKVLADWSTWCENNGYRLDFEAAGRVVYIAPVKRSSMRRRWRDIHEALDRCQELFGPSTGQLLSQSAELRLPDPTSPEGQMGPNGQTPVVFEVQKLEHWQSLMEQLVQQNAYLKDWASSQASQLGGFTLQRPLVAGWVENGPGREEWSPENELVHRLTHLSMLERFGQVPFWMTTGLSWQVEQEECGGIYSFPYRDGFVGVLEHGGWGSALRSDFKKRKKQDLSMTEVSAWQRGRFVDDQAAVSWGAARYLTRKTPAQLPALLKALAAHRVEHAVEDHADGTWTLNTDYRIPADQQQLIFAEVLGEDYLEELQSFFKKGCK